MLDVFSPVEGNTSVVEMLENRLAEAKKGKICYGCVILVPSAGEAICCYGGISGMEFAANFGCDIIKTELMELMKKKMKAPVNPEAPANRWYYDLFRMPVSFDFAGVLLAAEMTRIREGAPGPLRMAWYTGPNGNVTECLNTPEREQYFYGIVRPLLRLIGAVEDQTAIDGRTAINCSFAPLVENFERGEKLPTFSAPPQHLEAINEFLAENGVTPVTITLREATHSPHRNSNLPEWIKFANWLKDRGQSVIFIRDRAKSREPIDDQCICYAASEDLLIRCALYQRAKANLFVSNGPSILAQFADRPWLMFNELQDDNWYRAGTSKGWEKFTGIPPGGQFPWSRNDQRIIWHRDTFEVIRDAWLAHIAPSLSRQASGYQLEPEEEPVLAK